MTKEELTTLRRGDFVRHISINAGKPVFVSEPISVGKPDTVTVLIPHEIPISAAGFWYIHEQKPKEKVPKLPASRITRRGR